MLRRLLGILLVILVLAVIWGSYNLTNRPSTFTVVTSTPYRPLSGQPDGKIGDKITTWDYHLMVTGFEEANSYDDDDAGIGNKYVAVELEFESRVDNFEDFNSLYATLQNQDAVYPQVFAVKHPFFEEPYNLSKGSRITGWITYEVPKTAEGFWLVYQSFQHPKDKPIIIDLTK